MSRRICCGSAVLCSVSIAVVGASCSRQSLESVMPATGQSVTPQPLEAVQPVIQKPAGVKGMLTDGKWTSNSGISQGLIWQFLGDGTVAVQDGGSVDQSYRWETLSANENERQLKIKYWTITDGPNDFREWTWKFAPSGSTAVVENMRRKNGQLEYKGEMSMQKAQ